MLEAISAIKPDISLFSLPLWLLIKNSCRVRISKAADKWVGIGANIPNAIFSQHLPLNSIFQGEKNQVLESESLHSDFRDQIRCNMIGHWYVRVMCVSIQDKITFLLRKLAKLRMNLFLTREYWETLIYCSILEILVVPGWEIFSTGSRVHNSEQLNTNEVWPTGSDFCPAII